MPKILVRALVAVCVSLLVPACTDGQSPSELQTGPTAMLALALAPGLENLTQADALPITRIRITVFRVPDNSVVTVHEENVAPSAEFLDLAVEFSALTEGIDVTANEAEFLLTVNPASPNFAFIGIATSILGVPLGTCRTS